MVKAIARAFRWRAMLDNGTHATLTGADAAVRRSVDRSAEDINQLLTTFDGSS
jgi:hypothetical protein